MKVSRFALGFIRGYKNTPSVQLSNKTPTQISHLICRISQAGQGDIKFWSDINSKILSIYRDLGPRSIAFISNALCRSNIKDERVWRLLIEQSIATSDSFDGQDITLLLSSASKIYKSKDLFEHFSKVLLENEVLLKTKHIARIISAYSRIGYRDLDVLNRLFAECERYKSDLDFIDFGNILSGCYKLKYLNKSFIKILADELKLRLSSKILNKLSIHNISNILQPLAHSQIECSFIFSKLASILLNHNEPIGSVEATAIANALGKAKYNEAEILKYLIFQVYSNYANFTIDQLAIILYSLCRLDRMQTEFYVNVIGRLIANKELIKANDKTISMIFTSLSVIISNRNDKIDILDKFYPHIRLRLQRILESNSVDQCIVGSLLSALSRIGLEDPLIYSLIDKINTNLDNSNLAALLYGLGKFKSKISFKYIKKLLPRVSSISNELEPLHICNIISSLSLTANQFILEEPDKILLLRTLSSLSLAMLSKYDLFSSQLFSSFLISYTEIIEKPNAEYCSELHLDTVKELVIESIGKTTDFERDYQGYITFLTCPLFNFNASEYIKALGSIVNGLDSIEVDLLSRIVESNGRLRNYYIKKTIEEGVKEDYKICIDQLDKFILTLEKFVQIANNEAWLNIDKSASHFTKDKITLVSKIVSETSLQSDSQQISSFLLDKIETQPNPSEIIKSISNAIDYSIKSNRSDTSTLYQLINKLIPILLKESTSTVVDTATHLAERKIYSNDLYQHVLSLNAIGRSTINFLAALKNISFPLSPSPLLTSFEKYIYDKKASVESIEHCIILNALETLQKSSLLDNKLLNFVIDRIISSKPKLGYTHELIEQLLQLIKVIILQQKNVTIKSNDIISLEYQKCMLSTLTDWVVEALKILSTETQDAVRLTPKASGCLLFCLDRLIKQGVVNGTCLSANNVIITNILSNIALSTEDVEQLIQDNEMLKFILSSESLSKHIFSSIIDESTQINRLLHTDSSGNLSRLAYLSAIFLSCEFEHIKEKSGALLVNLIDILARNDTKCAGNQAIARICSILYGKHPKLLEKLTERGKEYLCKNRCV